MKVVGNDTSIQIVDTGISAWQVLKDITEAGNQEEAFYVADVDDIVRKYREWMQFLPRVEPHYAVKCNDNSVAISVIAALGLGFDCASSVEISKVINLGVNPNRIIFANPSKQVSHIRHALTNGVDLMTFDNQDELIKIKSVFPNARLVIRIRCDSSKATYPLGSKSGAEMEDVEDILTLAKCLDLNVIGVSFHVGSGCSDPPVYVKGIELSRSVFDTAEKLGFHFTLLNIGGGFPGKTGDSIIQYAELINPALELHFPKKSEIRVISEPGRYFVESAYMLATCVHSRRRVRKDGCFMYYINDGLYGSFNGRVFDNAGSVAIPVPVKSGGAKCLGSIWGPTCAGVDRVAAPIALPELQLGDWLAFPDMGAYTFVMSSNFNGFPIPRVHSIAREATWNILKNRSPLTENNFVWDENSKLKNRFLSILDSQNSEKTENCNDSVCLTTDRITIPNILLSNVASE